MGLKSPSLKTKIPWWFIIEWIDVILFTCDWSRVNNLNAAKSCRLRTIDVMASTDQLKSCSRVCVCVNVCEFSSLRLLWLSLVWVIKGEEGVRSVCVCVFICAAWESVGVGVVMFGIYLPQVFTVHTDTDFWEEDLFTVFTRHPSQGIFFSN